MPIHLCQASETPPATTLPPTGCSFLLHPQKINHDKPCTTYWRPPCGLVFPTNARLGTGLSVTFPWTGLRNNDQVIIAKQQWQLSHSNSPWAHTEPKGNGNGIALSWDHPGCLHHASLHAGVSSSLSVLRSCYSSGWDTNPSTPIHLQICSIPSLPSGITEEQKAFNRAKYK